MASCCGVCSTYCSSSSASVSANYALILLFYGIRGLAYPLFLYSFIVAIIHNVRSDSSSSALGWFWAVYSVGIGVFGSYIPSFTIPHIGEMGTLWLALLVLRHRRHHCAGVDASAPKRRAICRTSPLVKNSPNWGARRRCSIPTAASCSRSMVRIINTLSLFGFAVIMPMMFVDELGFTTSEWLQVWAAFFFTTIFSNVFWGDCGGENGLDEGYPLVRLHRDGAFEPGVLLPAPALRP